MTSITKSIFVAAPAHSVWDALRDYGALHTRLVPGFVTDTQLEPGFRVVTFASGQVLRERIVTVDDAARRLVWAVQGAPFEHHNGAAQVIEETDGCRFVWQADLLPESLAETVAALMSEGLRVMKATLERAAAR